MLEALCADADVAAGGILLLAPTGKAAVQLSARTKSEAQTLAKFLQRHERWDYDSAATTSIPRRRGSRGPRRSSSTRPRC